MFGPQKLDVYQCALDFVAWRENMLNSVCRRVAAADHLDRAGESIPLNIGHANSSWAPAERSNYIGHANGSALECAACLDILEVKELVSHDAVVPGKQLLQRIVCMLIRWKDTTDNQLRENGLEYQTKDEVLFDHEKLDVYRLSLSLAQWIEQAHPDLGCSSDLIAKLDKSSTSIVLNIAEGNGRFGLKDRKKFIATACKSAVRTASLLDIVGASQSTNQHNLARGQQMMIRISSMLTAWDKSL